MTRRVMVTGASGFVGRHLLPVLRESGCEAKAVTRADGERGAAHLLELAVAFRPDAVVHLATHFLSSHRPEDIPELIRANVEFGTAVAETAAATGAVLVNIGSAWQHMDGAAYRPVSLYAATKQALIPILDFYADAQGLRVRTVTLFDTYGPGDLRPKLVPSLLRAARDGAVLDMSDGQQLIDLTYIEDVVRGIAQVTLVGDAPAECVLRSWHPVTVRDLVAVVGASIECEVPVRWGVRASREREMRTDWVFGASPPGWSPVVDLAEGLRRTWASLLAAGPSA